MSEDSPIIIRSPIALSEVSAIAQRRFGDMAKAAVDLGRGVMALGGELHSDEEALLLDDGATQSDVWGINIYPAMTAPGAFHPGLASGRWQTLSISEQLGNIGSEVERAFRAREQAREDRFQHALARALELFDLTANDSRWHGHRRREVLRAREQFCRAFYDDNVETELVPYLRKYFLQFATAARAER